MNILAISSSLVVTVGIVGVVVVKVGKVGIVDKVGIVVGIMRRLAQGPGPPGILHCTDLHSDF